MANLTSNTTTNWVTVSPGTSVMASATGTFGSGTLIIQVRNLDASQTAVQVPFPAGVDGTAAFAIEVYNPSGQPREFRFSLSGATGPDIDCFIE